jgi:hypothetical protein
VSKRENEPDDVVADQVHATVGRDAQIEVNVGLDPPVDGDPRRERGRRRPLLVADAGTAEEDDVLSGRKQPPYVVDSLLPRDAECGAMHVPSASATANSRHVSARARSRDRRRRARRIGKEARNRLAPRTSQEVAPR